MLCTCKALREGGRVRRIEPLPEKPGVMQVHMSIQEQPDSELPANEPPFERGRTMGGASAGLVRRGTSTSIGDPVAWQRELCSEHTLPARET